MTAIRRVCLFACLCWSITDLAQAVQVTITWDCNTEADVMAYGIEMGRGNGWGLVAVIPHRMNGGPRRVVGGLAVTTLGSGKLYIYLA